MEKPASRRVSPGAVELADDDADVALEEPGADDDEEEAEVERRERRERHAEVPAGDDDAAVEDGPPLADEPVGDPAAGQRRHVDHRRVETVDRAGRGGVEPEPAVGERRDHEEDEQRAHPVVTEALPHLGEEERREPTRVAEEGAIVGSRSVHGVKHMTSRRRYVLRSVRATMPGWSCSSRPTTSGGSRSGSPRRRRRCGQPGPRSSAPISRRSV